MINLILKVKNIKISVRSFFTVSVAAFLLVAGFLYFSDSLDIDVAKADWTGAFNSCSSHGPTTGPYGWDYSLGYKFTPTGNGQVTHLCGYFSGKKWVRLYDSSYSILVSSKVDSSASWVCNSISPVNVSANNVYYIVAELASSGAYSNDRASPPLLPQTCDSLEINTGVYQYPSGIFNSNHGETATSVYGMADVVFYKFSYILSVAKTGTGSGSVGSSPAGINCGVSCSASFSSHTVVTLFANASQGSAFTGWSGAGCSGAGNCVVTMDSAKSVTASFGIAAPPEPIYGYAWSENIGWISFNCLNNDSCLTSNYAAGIDQVTGLFSGYAWSENIGWISLAPTGPYPASPNYSACIDYPGQGQICDGIGSRKVGGWARALSYSGSWDGWIKFQGSNYNVSLNEQSGEFSGWAWGGDVLGWISFNCSNQGVCQNSNYKVSTNSEQPPNVTADQETWNFCADSRHPILNWTYIDGTQVGYWIQIDGTSAGFNNLVVDTGEISGSSQSYATSYNFNWSNKYYWRVKAKNQQGLWSSWSNTANFTLPGHAYPAPDFSFLPASPSKNETVQFVNSSTAYGGSVIQSSSWTFQDGEPASSSLLNPTSKFSSSGQKTVNLQITDADPYNYSCSVSKPVNVVFPLPKWKEIAPF